MKKILVIIFVLLSASINAIEAEFSFNKNLTIINEGDIAEGTLKIWPLENVNSDILKNSLGAKLFDSLYISEVISSSPSINNADVYEFNAKFIITSRIENQKLFITYNGQQIPVKYRAISFNELKNKSKDFFILDQSTDGEWFWKSTQFLLIAIVLLFLGYRFQKWFLKSRRIKTENPKEKFKKMFLNAKARQDFEEIYKLKDEWMAILEIKAPAHFEFFKTLNEYQYKKIWSSEEESTVLESFDVIRRSFE